MTRSFFRLAPNLVYSLRRCMLHSLGNRPVHRLVPGVALAIALLAPQLAFAHALLVDSSPKANEKVHGPVLRIDLKFNSRVDAARSTVQLASSDGDVKTLAQSTQATPNEMITHADGLTRGSYTLRWQALASDGHVTRGQIPFQVE